MSSGYLSSIPWAPAPSWRIPSDPVLLNEVYETDDPPFDPFPVVTEVAKCAFCPLTVLHERFHGQSCPLVDEEAEAVRIYPHGGQRGWGVGKSYHEFIAWVKNAILSGKIPPDRNAILKELNRSVEYGRVNKETRIYVDPWIQSRIEEGDLAANENTYFEVQVAARVRFESERHVLRPYLLGKIDELDLKGERIIERTTREGEIDSKKFQVWLLWKILRSIDAADMPEPWRRDYSNFKLFIETPHALRPVNVKDVDFEGKAIRSLSLIRDMSDRDTRVRAIRRVYRESIPECRSKGKARICGITLCYAKRRRYPESRPAIHRGFREMYPPLLWESMWKRDKFRYQLMKLTREQLKSLGILYEGRIVESKTGQMRISLDASALELFRRREPEERRCLLLVGTPSMGVETNAQVRIDEQKMECALNYDWRKFPSTERVSLLLPDASLFRPEPVFLNTLRQRNLFSLERWGKDIDREARSDPTIQLLEALFGRRRLNAGGGFTR